MLVFNAKLRTYTSPFSQFESPIQTKGKTQSTVLVMIIILFQVEGVN